MRTSRIDRWVYAHTKKPKHYAEVRNPPKTIITKLLRPQDARQAQYNRWSKRFKVYSGSYLPDDSKNLLKKGWEDRVISQNGNRVMQRKSTGQTVRFEAHINSPIKHYHWLDLWKKKFTKGDYRKFKNRDYKGEDVYYNKYGQLTSRRDPEHHLYGSEGEK